MNIAILLAGGVGSRLNAGIPKQFIKVLGKPIIAYTLEKFQNNKNIDAIEVVCLKSHMNYIREITEIYGISKVLWLVEGGKNFQESAMNGVFHLNGKIAREDIVLLQFAVSPMISDEIINDSIQVCSRYGSAVAADEMVMCTCIKTDVNSSSQGILRENLVGLNAPWSFRFEIIYEAYKEAIEKGILEDLEPHTVSLMFALGKTLYFSKSSTSNIKITHKEDLDLFEGFLLLEQKRAMQEEKESRK